LSSVCLQLNKSYTDYTPYYIDVYKQSKNVELCKLNVLHHAPVPENSVAFRLNTLYKRNINTSYVTRTTHKYYKRTKTN